MNNCIWAVKCEDVPNMEFWYVTSCKPRNFTTRIDPLEITHCPYCGNKVKVKKMTRITKQETIDKLTIDLKQMSNKAVNLEKALGDCTSKLSSRDKKILELKTHVSFVMNQKHRLLGYIEGQKSIVDPEMSKEVPVYQSTAIEKLNRVDEFIRTMGTDFLRLDSTGNIEVTNRTY